MYMLRITVDINGRKIGQVAAVRQSSEPKERNEYEIYSCESVDEGESVIENGELLGSVMHTYNDGAAKLAEIVLSEIENFDT